MTVNHIDQGVYEYLRRQNAKLLDVRTPSEYAQGHIPGSVNVPLRNIDEVAYVRFASVYRQFSDVNTFFEELSELLKKKNN